MEHVLWFYAPPYGARSPVICFDERPCFFIGEVVAPFHEGHGQKEQYAYEKHGSCALLAAIEPLTGPRLALVFPQRTKQEDTECCQALVALYPQASKLQLVQDNWNTHNASAFYAHLPADEAFAWAQKIEFHYTPKSASWLNMSEIESSAVSRQCLNRRSATIDVLRAEVLTFVNARSKQKIQIHWQFSLDKARTKLNRHYEKVQADNVTYKAT
jgi:hypothetical protein